MGMILCILTNGIMVTQPKGDFKSYLLLLSGMYQADWPVTVSLHILTRSSSSQCLIIVSGVPRKVFHPYFNLKSWSTSPEDTMYLPESFHCNQDHCISGQLVKTESKCFSKRNFFSKFLNLFVTLSSYLLYGTTALEEL